ncbi:hypothetical protein KBD20_02210 [Candidatus Saccharibacteria bacterium]|nr:hypothetical protein [Candidatus Saccharibacteria bacterium]
MALLTSIIMIAWSITNRSTQIMLGARERVVMVDQVKEQAEIIKAKWAVDQTYFNNATIFPAVAAGQLNSYPCSSTTAPPAAFSPTGGFAWYLTANTTTITPQSGVKNVNADTNKRVWVQKVPVAATAPDVVNYTDFYVRACWINNSGGVQTEENTQIILRLNT